MRWLLIVALIGCSGTRPPDRDAGEGRDAVTDAVAPVDAPRCSPIAECIVDSGLVAFCPAVHQHFAALDADRYHELARCEHWEVCGPCYSCRDWSTRPELLSPPDEPISGPPCASDICPVRDAGLDGGDAGRDCPDAF